MFANHWSRSWITYEHLFLSFLYSGIGSKCTSIPTNVLGSPRVYRPVLHIGDHAHLRGDYWCDHFCLCQICLWIGLLNSLPVVTLSCMVSKNIIVEVNPYILPWEGISDLTHTHTHTHTHTYLICLPMTVMGVCMGSPLQLYFLDLLDHYFLNHSLGNLLTKLFMTL